MSDNFYIYADGVDITGYAGNVSWQNTVDELATSVSFEVAKTDTKYLNFYAPNEGSIVSIKTFEEIFKGIVIAVDDGSLTVNKYTVCDFGWYLNKSSETYQFNKMNAKKAIMKICNDYGVPIDTIPELNTEITQLYLDKVLSDIIKDILELCGGGYNLDVTPKGVRIYKLGTVFASPNFKITPNTRMLLSAQFYGNLSHIGKYGLLQKVVKIDPEKDNPLVVANTQLAELNRKKESFSCEIIESLDGYTRAGSIIEIEGVRYLIEGSGHSFKNSIHYVKLDLRRWE